jgi:hypothetical protein
MEGRKEGTMKEGRAKEGKGEKGKGGAGRRRKTKGGRMEWRKNEFSKKYRERVQ